MIECLPIAPVLAMHAEWIQYVPGTFIILGILVMVSTAKEPAGATPVRVTGALMTAFGFAVAYVGHHWPQILDFFVHYGMPILLGFLAVALLSGIVAAVVGYVPSHFWRRLFVSACAGIAGSVVAWVATSLLGLPRRDIISFSVGGVIVVTVSLFGAAKG